MPAKLKRINARISGELDALLQELAAAQGRSVSDIVVTALKEFCAQQSVAAGKSTYDLFNDAGLIGCFQGGKHLSRDYKQTYGDLLDEKWPSR